MIFGRGSGSVDGAVLAELRGIRQDLQTLGDRVAKSATREEVREELDGYVTKEVFDAHVASGLRISDLVRGWLPIGLASFALLWSIISPYFHFGAH